MAQTTSPARTSYARGAAQDFGERNLYDTSSASPVKGPPPDTGPFTSPSAPADGAFNDLENPAMGSSGTRFGRNVPVELTYPENGWALLKPSPRKVSRG